MRVAPGEAVREWIRGQEEYTPKGSCAFDLRNWRLGARLLGPSSSSGSDTAGLYVTRLANACDNTASCIFDSIRSTEHGKPRTFLISRGGYTQQSCMTDRIMRG
jgi:hypothetical protein